MAQIVMQMGQIKIVAMSLLIVQQAEFSHLLEVEAHFPLDGILLRTLTVKKTEI
jgi:hypothetical protein